MVRIGLFAALILFALRIAIGFHFYKEGVAKVRNPDFSSSQFLYQAKGPLADFYRSFTPDARVRERLDMKRTLAEWRAFRDTVSKHYGFGRKEDLERQRKILADLRQEQAKAAEAGKSGAEEFKAREGEIKKLERLIAQLEKQDQAAGEVYKRYEGQLVWLLQEDGHAQELEEYFLELDRLERAKADPSRNVAFRRSWMEEKESELRGKSQAWIKQIDQMQRNFQRDLLALTTAEQRAKGELSLPPLDRNFVDAAVTWLTVGVGVCLLLGLFTRAASIAGALFLASVISTQPFWISDAAPVYKEVIELFALLLLAALAAGRYGGLDYFLHSFFARRRRVAPQET